MNWPVQVQADSTAVVHGFASAAVGGRCSVTSLICTFELTVECFPILVAEAGEQDPPDVLCFCPDNVSLQDGIFSFINP